MNFEGTAFSACCLQYGYNINESKQTGFGSSVASFLIIRPAVSLHILHVFSLLSSSFFSWYYSGLDKWL